jgi:glutamate-1-semialdehyde 2,1-aminomutase
LDLRERWRELASRHGLEITIQGLPALSSFSFPHGNGHAYKTLIAQEMLDRGFLAGTSVYVCIDHSSRILEDYFASLDRAFALIKECQEGRDVLTLLRGPICHTGFQRLN